VCEVNDRGKKHEFHASTLRIFTGTVAEAEDLAKLDNLELDITRVIGIIENTANRDELEVTIEFEDGTIDSMEYSSAIHTSAFAEYCQKMTVGNILSMTRAELTQYARENSPKANESIIQHMTQWPAASRYNKEDRILISGHHWNNTTWHIHMQENTLPRDARNREPMFLAIIVKITKKTIDLEIPILAKTTGARAKKNIIALSLPRMLLFTSKEHDMRELSYLMTHQLLDTCESKEKIHIAAGK
jgi:hypothetical protein